MTYEVLTRLPSGKERVQTYESDDPLSRRRVAARRSFLLVEHRGTTGGRGAACVREAARYRIRLRHPDDREELGAVRRIQPGRRGSVTHSLQLERGRPVSWRVVDEQLDATRAASRFDLRAERDYAKPKGSSPPRARACSRLAPGRWFVVGRRRCALPGCRAGPTPSSSRSTWRGTGLDKIASLHRLADLRANRRRPFEQCRST
jgi:hypothetical protein